MTPFSNRWPCPPGTVHGPGDVALAVVATVTHLRLTTGAMLPVDGAAPHPEVGRLPLNSGVVVREA